MLENLLSAVMVSVAAYLVLRVVVAVRSRISGKDARAKVQAGASLVDVRSEVEFASGALPGAKNIPVQALAGRLGEIDKAKPVVVYCASGMRSARAASILKSAGFEAHDLGPKSAW